GLPPDSHWASAAHTPELGAFPPPPLSPLPPLPLLLFSAGSGAGRVLVPTSVIWVTGSVVTLLETSSLSVTSPSTFVTFVTMVRSPFLPSCTTCFSSLYFSEFVRVSDSNSTVSVFSFSSTVIRVIVTMGGPSSSAVTTVSSRSPSALPASSRASWSVTVPENPSVISSPSTLNTTSPSVTSGSASSGRPSEERETWNSTSRPRSATSTRASPAVRPMVHSSTLSPSASNST